MPCFHRNRYLAFLWALALLPVFLCGHAAAEKDPTCFDFVWSNAHDDPWFLDEQGQRVIPEVSREWLAVDFGVASVQSDLSDESMPETFNLRYAEFFDYRLAVPGNADTLLFHVREQLPYGAFDALIKRLREDPAVRFAQPVWRIDSQLHAPAEQIAVTWKTVAAPQERRQLLEAAGAVETSAGESPDTDLIRIDPCRRPPWQAAVLLAQDLRVVSAAPRLRKIEPPVAVRFEVETPGAPVGTPIPFRFEIRFAEGIRIESATLASLDLKPRGIFRNLYEVNFDHPLSGIDLSRSPITITGRLLIHAPGDTVVPPIPVYYRDSRADNDQQLHTLDTGAIPLRIAALVPEASDDHRLRIASPVAPHPLARSGLAGQQRTALLMTVAGLILLTTAIVGWLWINRRSVPVAGDGEDQALRRHRDDLAAWIGRDPATMRLKECLAFGAALKEYLAEMAGIPPQARGGSHAFFSRQLENRLPEDDQARASLLLREIDHLLAGGPIVAERVRPLLDQARLLVESLEARFTTAES